jgi:hypothetical protein
MNESTTRLQHGNGKSPAANGSAGTAEASSTSIAPERRRLANLFFDLTLHRRFNTRMPPTLAQAKTMLIDAYRAADRFLARRRDGS